MCERPTEKRWSILAAIALSHVWLADASGLRAQADESSPVVAKTRAAQVAIGERKYDDARGLLREALGLARESGDREEEGGVYFFFGLADQQEAKGTSDPNRSRRLLDSASAYYRRALRIRPRWGPVLNNLAQVRERLGNNEQAQALYREALAVGGRHQTVYTRNYADYLARTGRDREALRYFTRVFEARPDDPSAHRRIVEQYLELDDRPELLSFLWMTARRSSPSFSRDAALRLVADPERREGIWRELMGIVALCLSREHYDPRGFGSTEGGEAIAGLGGEADIERCRDELLLLHTGDQLAPSEYPWWRDEAAPRVSPRRESSREAFRALVRSLGQWQLEAKDARRAERYFRLAALLDPGDPDPDALLDLAKLYIAQERIDDLHRFMKLHEVDIFEAKGAAYSADRLDRIFKFHQALGVIYAHLGRWGSESDPTTALFQLSRALAVADKYAEQAREERGQADRRTMPQLVDLLAHGYEETGRPESGMKVRLDYAKRLLDSGDLRAAERVYRPVEGSTSVPTSPAERRKYEILRRELPELWKKTYGDKKTP